jgi:hypothetical protein
MVCVGNPSQKILFILFILILVTIQAKVALKKKKIAMDSKSICFLEREVKKSSVINFIIKFKKKKKSRKTDG